MIILTYCLSVLCKWVYEALGWLDANKGNGARVYWEKEKYRIGRKVVLHVILGTLWSMGLLLAVTNTALAAVGVGALATVTWQSTLAAGFMIDTLGKPLIEKFLKAAE